MGKGIALSREGLLAGKPLKKVKVVLDEKGDEFVFVREMKGNERDSFETTIMNLEGFEDDGTPRYSKTMNSFRSKLAVHTVCDEEGKLLFKADDWATLGDNISAVWLDKIVKEAQKLNKMDKGDVVKNSDTVQPGDSSSDSV